MVIKIAKNGIIVDRSVQVLRIPEDFMPLVRDVGAGIPPLLAEGTESGSAVPVGDARNEEAVGAPAVA